MKVVSQEELKRLMGRGDAEHTLADYLYEIGRGAATGIGRGAWDRYLAAEEGTTREGLSQRLAEIRAERLREHPLGGTTGGKLLQAGGEMLPLMLAGEVLPAAMLMKKGVSAGSILKGMIPFTKSAMPSLRLPALQRITSAGVAGTIIGGAERKLQEPDASAVDVTKHALVQGAMWGAGESLGVALGALVKKFGSQRGLITTPDEDFVWRAKNVFGVMDKGEIPVKDGNSESILYALGINKTMQNELGFDVACQMGRHSLETGYVPLPQTRLLKAQRTPAGIVDMSDVWIGGMNKKGENIYNGMPVWSAGKRGEKGFIQSTHMYGVGKNLNDIKWVDTDLSGTIAKKVVYTEEQLTKRLWGVELNTPTAYAGLEPEVRTTLLTAKIDELNVFNKRSRDLSSKVSGIPPSGGIARVGKLLRKGQRYDATIVEYPKARGGVDRWAKPTKTKVTDSADNLLKRIEDHAIHLEGVTSVGVDMPVVELPIPIKTLVKPVAEEVVSGGGRYYMQGVTKHGWSRVTDDSMNMLQRGFKKLEDMCLVPMWRKGPNTTKLVSIMDKRGRYQDVLNSEYAKNIAKKSALIQRSMSKKLGKEQVGVANELLTAATVNKKFYTSRTEASAILGKIVPEDSWRYYRAEADAVFYLHKQKAELSLIQQGYYKMNPQDPVAMEIFEKVQTQLKEAHDTFYIPMSVKGKYLVVKKRLGVAPDDYSRGSNDATCICDNVWERNSALKRFAADGGDVQAHSNLTRYQDDYFKEFPSPDMMEELLERGGYSADQIKDMLDTVHKLKGQFSLIGRHVEKGFDSSKMSLQIQNWSDKMHKAMAREKFKNELAELVLSSRGAEDGHYVAEMISRLNTMGGDAFAKTRTIIYGWHLGGKLSFPIQNSTQSYLNTLPECIDQDGWIKGAANWWKAHRYMKYFLASPEKRLKLADTISDPYVKRGLSKLHAEGKISAGMTQEWMHAQKAFGVRRLSTDVEGWIGLYGTKSEQALRGHAATAALISARDRGLSLDVGVGLARKYIDRTQFPFKSYNIPQMFVGGGNMRHASKFLYMYKGFMANQIARSLDVWATGRTRYIAAQAMTMMSLYGLAGVPGYALARKAFMKTTGEDFETKMKNYLKNPDLKTATNGFVDYMFSKGGWKAEAGKVMINGLPSLAGVSTENWVGLGDVPYTDLDRYLGVLTMYKPMIQAYDKVSKGHGIAAVAELMPSAIKNVLKAYEWNEKGLVDRTGQVIYEPKWADIARKSIGIPSQKVTETYKIRHLVKTEVYTHKANVADFNYKIKEAYKSKDRKSLSVIMRDLQEYNMQHPARQIKPNFNRLYKEALERLEPSHIEGIPDWAVAKHREYERAYR